MMPAALLARNVFTSTSLCSIHIDVSYSVFKYGMLLSLLFVIGRYCIFYVIGHIVVF